MRFQCSHCRGILAIDDGAPGEAVACGHCGTAVAVPETRLSPGAIIGDFIIRERLGEGGMGTVYLTHQISLDRSAAVKILHDRYGSDPAYIQDFVREARAAAAINHPNIVQAYAVGEDEGLFYFAMEYVQGSTLKQVLLHGGRLVADRALDIALQVAGALDFAWRSQGLVHRDIKPDNIILTADGAVKLADLGLARKMTDTASDGSQELYGTPQYIAPEHLLGSLGDNRSDIYSLGATLFHALTGRFPFQGTSPADIAQRHLIEALPAVMDLCPDIPAGLGRIVQVMLSKRAQHRYPDAAALLLDLEAVRQGGEPAYTPDPASQEPIDADSAEADAIAAGPSVPPQPPDEVPPPQTEERSRKRRLSFSKPAAAPGAPTVAPAQEEATDEPAAEDGESAVELTDGAEAVSEGPVRAPRKKIVLIIAAAAGIIILGCVVGAFLLLKNKQTEGAGAGTVGESPKTDSRTSAAVAEVLKTIRNEIAQGRAEGEVRTRLAGVVAEFGFEHDEADNFASLAAPYIELDLNKARQPLYEAERRQWEELGASAKAKAAEEAERAKREAEAEAQRQRKAEEEARAAAAKAQQEAQVEQQKKEVRVRAAELCRQHQFNEASRLFVPLASTRDETLKRWAEQRQTMIAVAGKLFESIVNSKDQMAGLALPVPAQPKVDWRVSRIGYKDVELEARRVVYTKGKREEQTETLEIPFAELTPIQLDKLTEKKWELDSRDKGERNLLFGTYLLVREQYVAEARKRLEASDREEADRVLEELKTIEPELRKAEFDGLIEQLKQYVQQGDKRHAAAMIEHLQRNFPEEAEAKKDELRGLVGEP